MVVRLSGFADEAADDLEGQIEVTRELGWKSIELRSVWGANVLDLSDADFSRVRALLAASGIGVNAVGSTIANWGRSLDEDERLALDAAGRAVPRLHALGARQIRIMSWKVVTDADGAAAEDQREAERIRRLRSLCERFTAEGITPVHENCATWGGMSWRHTLRMVESVPGLKLVFDTGNPPVTPDYPAGRPYPMQSTREYWDRVKEHVVHLHLKDTRRSEAGEEIYCWPGEGEGDVEYVLGNLESIDYDGYLTIEPHMQVVFHDASVTAPAAARRQNYIEYGRRAERLLDRLGVPRA